MEEGVKVAILDNGVMDIFYEELKENIYIDEENSINNASIYRNKYSSHGTSCFLILKQFAKSSRISSVEILNEDGKGSIEKLIPAFEWCVENDIKIVNLSFGSIHFKDAEIIQNIINHYASKGIIIIAASSNSGYTSYPSYFSNVIGVANIEDSGIKDDMVRVNNVHTGVDFLAVSQHTIYIEDENIILSKSNSYAAPFVTSQVYNILSHNVNLTLYEVKKTLINQLKKQNEESSLFYCEPNWIENAYIVGGKLKSKARTYFKLFKNCSYEDVKEKIDTLIIFNENDLNFYLREKKNIVYLGNDFDLQKCINEKYIWHKSLKEKKIDEEIIIEEDIKIPIIIINFSINDDELLILQNLKNLFFYESYNLYAATTNPEGVFYNLEYIPKKYISNVKERNTIKSFLYKDTYYKRSDIIILSYYNNEKKLYESKNAIKYDIGADLVISIEHSNIYKVIFNDNENEQITKEYENIGTNEIRDIYLQILDTFKT